MINIIFRKIVTEYDFQKSGIRVKVDAEFIVLDRSLNASNQFPGVSFTMDLFLFVQ